MKLFLFSKYLLLFIVSFILITFIIFWLQIYNSSNLTGFNRIKETFSEALLYYIWGILITFSK